MTSVAAAIGDGHSTKPNAAPYLGYGKLEGVSEVALTIRPVKML